jgi:hypothetical protein
VIDEQVQVGVLIGVTSRRGADEQNGAGLRVDYVRVCKALRERSQNGGRVSRIQRAAS